MQMMYKKENKFSYNFLNSMMTIPSPSSITYMWNFGSLLGVCLAVQIISGVVLSMHYSCSTEESFLSVNHIMRDVNMGWLFRLAHSNGASMFFICLYLHLGRGIYYGSFNYKKVWLSGSVMLLLIMVTAFLGYVLPWGQMSLWGATVITNLASAIPIIGENIVFTLWGGFSVGSATLTRFFTFHFIMPFLIAGVAMIHVVLLHVSGSSSPLGVNSNFDKTYFHNYFLYKDLLGISLFMFIYVLIIFQAPVLLGDPENFIPADSMVTPTHIQPEWYFLFAYAILRAIPNKLGGVLALALSVLIVFSMPFYGSVKFKSKCFSPSKKILFWSFIAVVFMLTLLGAKPVDPPYILSGQILTCLYFMYFMILPAEKYL